MNNSIDRRRFLQMAGAVAAGCVAAPSSRRATVPVGAGGANQARLLAGCCARSYDQYMKSGQMTLEDFIHKGVELRLDGIDMTLYYVRSTEPEYLAGLRRLALRNGIPFSGTACGVMITQADKTKRAQALDETKKWIDVTDQLGASHLRVFPGQIPSDATTAQGIGWAVEVLKPTCDYAAKRGITLGLEDHPQFTVRADTILEILRRVDSPYVGINLDITHFIPTPTEDRYAQIEACIPYATQTHIRYRFDSGEVIDLDRVWQMFVKAGYKGYMSAEYEEEPEDPATGVPRLVAEVKRLCRKYSPA
jgi:sugar phosphate isomerase/epimerase